MRLWVWFVVVLSVLAAPLSMASAAQKSPLEIQAEAFLKENEGKFAYGPTTIKLGGQASMVIERGQAFMPPEIAQQMFAIFGQKKVDGLMGIIVPGLPGDEVPTDDWGFVGLFFNPLGFVRDDDAKSWNYERLLDSQRKNIEQSNEHGREQGRAERELNGWIERPNYDSATHRLLWATASQEKGKPDTALALYNAAALGREGILVFTFGTPAANLPARKNLASTMLSGIQFSAGKRYEDYAEGTDRVAEIGLAALVGGVAAKKLGLFAVLAVFLAKWGKLLAASLGLFALFKWRKKKPGTESQA